MRSTTQRCRPPRAPDSTPGGRSAPCCRAAAAAGSGDSRRRCRRAAWPPRPGRPRGPTTAGTASTSGSSSSASWGGRGQGDRHRQPASVGQQVRRRAGVAAVNRVRTGQRPLVARTATLSTLARDPSIEPSSPSQSSSRVCSAVPTRPPARSAAAAHRSPGCRRRAPARGGVARAPRCAAARRCRRCPARSPIHGRPPRGCGRLAGSSGSIACHSSSGPNCSAPCNDRQPVGSRVTAPSLTPNHEVVKHARRGRLETAA